MNKLLSILLVLPFLVTAQTAFDKGEAFFKKEDFSKAKPLFQQYLAENPTSDKTREYLGDIEGYAKNWDEALEYYEPLVQQYPKNANYHFKVGGVLGMKALENKLAAITIIDDIKFHFEKAAELDPNHIDARWALVEFYMQLPGIFGGSERKAEKYAAQLQKISAVDGYLAKGYIAEYNDREADAERYYKQAIRVGGSPHTYEKLSNLYEKQNRGEDALATTAESLQKHKRNRLNYQIGKIVAQYKLNAEKGIAALLAYIENYTIRDGVPKDWAYYRLAQIYKNIGNKQKALQWIDKALASRPDFDEAQDEKEEILSL
ncbi:tetratricopeptide repeat protein [Flavobacteriaceae bacterium TK19130]|nr:tetratricopeptide repeat protein [Thermobacterium salinum]